MITHLKSFSTIFFLLCAVLLIQSCGKDSTSSPVYEIPAPFDTTKAIKDSTTSDGLEIYIMKEGNGPFKVVSNDQISVSYTGRTPDGKVFDSSYRSFSPTTIFNNLTPVTIVRNGRQYSPLIDGFRRGILGMKEGGKRVIVVPPALGYKGSSNSQLEGKTLIFDVELISIN